MNPLRAEPRCCHFGFHEGKKLGDHLAFLCEAGPDIFIKFEIVE